MPRNNSDLSHGLRPANATVGVCIASAMLLLLTSCATVESEKTVLSRLDKQHDCIYPTVVIEENQIRVHVLHDYRQFRQAYARACRRHYTILSNVWSSNEPTAAKVAVTPFALAASYVGLDLLTLLSSPNCNIYSLDEIEHADSIPGGLLNLLQPQGVFTGRITVIMRDAHNNQISSSELFDRVPATHLSMPIDIASTHSGMARIDGYYDSHTVSCNIHRALEVRHEPPSWATLVQGDMFWWETREHTVGISLAAPIADSFLVNGIISASPAALAMPTITISSDGDQITAEPRFAIGRFPVTIAEFNQFRAIHGHPLIGGADGLGFSAKAQKPVTHVTFDEAVEYSNWLSQETGERWRLPTLDEWNYAATFAFEGFPWGSDFGKACLFANLGRDKGVRPHRRCSNTEHKDLSRVGSFPGLPPGIHDLYGNVWEMTSTCLSSKEHSSDEGQHCRTFIALGGSYKTSPQELKMNSKRYIARDYSTKDIGFRLVREL